MTELKTAGSGLERLGQERRREETQAGQARADLALAYRISDDAAGKIRRDVLFLRRYLDLMGWFPRLSAGNLLLLCAQEPDALEIRTAEEWKARGAEIREGARGILLLSADGERGRADGSAGFSFFPKIVYDVKRTTAPGRAPDPEGAPDGRLCARAILTAAACPVREEPYPDAEEKRSARYDPEDRVLYLGAGWDAPARFRDAAEAAACAFFAREGWSPEESAFPAVCAARALCARFGQVDSRGIRQIPESFQALGTRAVRAQLGKIRSAVSRLGSETERICEARKSAPEIVK